MTRVALHKFTLASSVEPFGPYNRNVLSEPHIPNGRCCLIVSVLATTSENFNRLGLVDARAVGPVDLARLFLSALTSRETVLANLMPSVVD